jgi:hypothetical protein
MKVKMIFTKSTKGTHVYNAVDGGEDILPTVYIKRDALPKTPPQSITLTIEVNENETV